MKTQMFLKGAMVAIVLFVGAALFAGTSGVKCEGSVVDQYGEGIVGITVTTTSGPSVSATTNSLGRFSMSGIQASLPFLKFLLPDSVLSVIPKVNR